MRANHACVLWHEVGPCTLLPMSRRRCTRWRGAEAALEAAQRVIKADDDVKQATKRDLENARYEASLASRRYEAVDPAKRLVARELESRWNIALERVVELEQRLARMD